MMTGTESQSSAMREKGGNSEGLHENAHRIRAVIKLAESHRYDEAHAHRVANLAMRLFDDLAPLHGMGREERFWLVCAAIVHDIAKANAKHHKAAFRIVLTAEQLPFDLLTRTMVGLTARYHRKAAPSLEHTHYAGLNEGEREIVRKLSALLRVADALDAGHRGMVKSVRCEIDGNQIIGRCLLGHNSEIEHRRSLKRKALDKSTLFQDVFGYKLCIKWGAK